jgi:uncharacterized protein (DUF433 family)
VSSGNVPGWSKNFWQNVPEVLGGTLVFVGTPVPAQTLLDYVSRGGSFDEFLDDFPAVKRGDPREFLQLTREERHS